MSNKLKVLISNVNEDLNSTNILLIWKRQKPRATKTQSRKCTSKLIMSESKIKHFIQKSKSLPKTIKTKLATNKMKEMKNKAKLAMLDVRKYKHLKEKVVTYCMEGTVLNQMISCL